MASLAKWLSFRLRIKWLLVQVPLQSLKLQDLQFAFNHFVNTKRYRAKSKFCWKQSKAIFFGSKLKESQDLKHRAEWYQTKEYNKSKYLGCVLVESL